MRIFNRKDWLRPRVTDLLREKHAELFSPGWKQIWSKTIEFCFHRNQWWLIAALVASCFYLSKNIPIQNFHYFRIHPDTAKTIVDQRTTNLATIISITLVVVGFLINNLAIKEAFAYKLLFRHSYLYPVVYLTLCTIGCFVITSTIRDKVNGATYARAVFIGTCIVLLILLLIGLLFRSIIDFTNPKRIDGLFHRELINEAASSLKANLLKVYSKTEMKSFWEKHNVQEYNVTAALLFANDGKRHEISETMGNPDKIFYNLNLEKLEQYFAHTEDNEFYYLPWALGDLVDSKSNLIWAEHNSETPKRKARLSRYIVLRKVTTMTKDKAEVRKYFDQKFEDAVADNKFRSVEKLLQSFIELYQMEIRNQPKHG